MSSNLIC